MITLMIVRNNYFWVDKDSRPGFLANGDIVEIMRILEIRGNVWLPVCRCYHPID
ncbi:MAG: hypothetical protein MZV63_09670 [Marinilabiliales bacterium]|nr:hypothetical protein [Marinilabiliales bacterium]